jgi:hypothetical protein
VQVTCQTQNQRQQGQQHHPPSRLFLQAKMDAVTLCLDDDAAWAAAPLLQITVLLRALQGLEDAQSRVREPDEVLQCAAGGVHNGLIAALLCATCGTPLVARECVPV